MKILTSILLLILYGQFSQAEHEKDLSSLLQQTDFKKVERDIQGLPQTEKNKALYLAHERISSMPVNDAAQLVTAVLKGGAAFTDVEYSGQSIGIFNFLSPDQLPEIFKAVIEFTRNPDPMIFLGGCGLVEEIFPDIKGKATDGCDGPLGTPLMLMAYRGDLPTVKYLVNKGADKDKRIKVSFVNGPLREKEMRAIDFARLKKRTDIIKFLEEKKSGQ